MPPIEPLKIEDLQIGGGKGAVKVDQYYKNALLHGFSKAIIDDVKYVNRIQSITFISVY